MEESTKENNENNGEIKKTKSKRRENLEAVFIAIAVALLLRAFVVEAFKIPSSSMVPNLKVGDHIFVNKYIYGIRIPFTLKQLFPYKKPRRGEIIVFNYPKDTSKDYIKRVVGLPGDRIRIDDQKIYVNNRLIERVKINDPKIKHLMSDIPNNENYTIYSEKSQDNISYYVIYKNQRLWGFPEINCLYCSSPDSSDLKVPDGYYFVMGDNRDNSSDSRRWGFVPSEYIKGRALFTWLSLNSDRPLFWIIPGIRWERFGRLIK